MQLKPLLFGLALLFGPLAAKAATCPTYPYVLTNGQTADANQVMANFNAILSCANTSVATAGVNSNITALIGMTTPLSVSEGGTGQVTSPVVSFNTRAGAVTLLSGDVAAALGSAPLTAANNLSDVASASTARINLGVTATGADTTYAFRASNLSDLASVSSSRTNLGVTATGSDTTYAFRANNLSDLASVSTALNNILPAQGSASGKVLSSNGSAASWSPLTTLFGAQSVGANGYITLPGGLIMEWGTSGSITNNSSGSISLPLTFPTAIFSVTVTPNASAGSGGMAYAYTFSRTTSSFSIFNAGANSVAFAWVAFGD